MTTHIFIILFVLFSAISSLLTEAIKIGCKNKEKPLSANLIAIICAIVVGGIGSCFAFVFLSIPFTLVNCLSIVCMSFAIGLGSMVGFDKITQLISQINIEK